MSTDSIKLWLTYAVVLVTILGGFAILVFIPLDDLTKGAIIGFVGMSLNFVYGAEVQTRTARQQERALLTAPPTANGITSAYPEAGGTATVTLTQEPASETDV